MIEVVDLTKRYRSKTVVEGLTFTARPGRVTGFLGPNGAGKSTTLRMILGLDRPSGGHTLVEGKPYTQHDNPMSVVGSLLDPDGVHPGRTAINHLRMLAAGSGIALSRADLALDLVGLGDVGGDRVKGFSLGMRQRLALGAAFLGRPRVLVLDEPLNGLDTEGIRWVRGLLRTLAAEGRTILLSSHLMSEMELVADDLVVMGHGRLLAAEEMSSFVTRYSGDLIQVDSADNARLGNLINRCGGQVETRDGVLLVRDLDQAAIGELSVSGGIGLRQLTPVRSRLEDVFTELVKEHAGHQTEHMEVA